MQYDVVIVGGGPAGLSAALALGRARRRVLLCDSGPRRNAAATHMQNFVTRDGIPPGEFRRLGEEQLTKYGTVELRSADVQEVTGTKGAFTLVVDGMRTEARRIILATGMIDEAVPIEGFRELWGHSVFQCPYCHGWELRERPWGYLARDAAALHFAVLLRSWSSQVTAFTNAAFEIEPPLRAHLEVTGVRIVTEPLARLRGEGKALKAVELVTGDVVTCEALFAHPPQKHVKVVQSLQLALDAEGFVRVDAMTRETSIPGVYAAGDLTTRAQGAIFAAATGTHAAGMLNHELIAELASHGLV